MIVKNLIKKTAKLLELLEVENADLESENLDEEIQKDINVIISCINEALTEIASGYMPLKTEEEIIVENEIFDLSKTSKDYYKVVKIVPEVKFREFENALHLQNGVYKLTYCYLPEIVNLNSEINCFGGALTEKTICLATAKEYALVSGNFSESEMWNSKFLEQIKSNIKPLKNTVIKSRRWLL